MKRIVILIIMLFSFSVISLADNARFDARREAKQDVNETVWALTGFSVPLLIGGYYMAGGTTDGQRLSSYAVSVDRKPHPLCNPESARTFLWTKTHRSRL